MKVGSVACHLWGDSLISVLPHYPDPGLKATFEAIDNRSDFKTYMQHYAYAHGGTNPRAPRREGPREEGYVGLSLLSFECMLTHRLLNRLH